jgi:hypothetical protein
MNCCDAAGNCTNGPDCPVRKQRIKEINDAYTNGYNDASLDDPYTDTLGTFRALVIVLAVCIAVTLLSYVLWGK